MQKMPCLADKPDCTLDIADAKGKLHTVHIIKTTVFIKVLQ